MRLALVCLYVLYMLLKDVKIWLISLQQLYWSVPYCAGHQRHLCKLSGRKTVYVVVGCWRCRGRWWWGGNKTGVNGTGLPVATKHSCGLIVSCSFTTQWNNVGNEQEASNPNSFLEKTCPLAHISKVLDFVFFFSRNHDRHLIPQSGWLLLSKQAKLQWVQKLWTSELTLQPGGRQIQNVALSASAFALKTMQPQSVALLFRNVVNGLLTTGRREHFGLVGL